MYYTKNYLLAPSFDNNCFFVLVHDEKGFIPKCRINLSNDIKIVTTPISDGIFLNILDGKELIRFRIKRNGEPEEIRHNFYPSTIDTQLCEPVYFEKYDKRYLITYLQTTSEILVVDISKKDVINREILRYPVGNEKVELLAGADQVILYTKSGELVIIPITDPMTNNISNAVKLSNYSGLAFKPVFRDNHLHLFCKSGQTLTYYKINTLGSEVANKYMKVDDDFPVNFNFPLFQDAHFLLPFNQGKNFIKIIPNHIALMEKEDRYSPNHFLIIDNNSYMLSNDHQTILRVGGTIDSPFTGGMKEINVINSFCYGGNKIFIQTDDNIYIKSVF